MFLSIVTRCYKRPKMLDNNVQSLKRQMDQDYEQIFLVDEVGYGLAWANKQFHRHRDKPQGEYVLMLDDDDMLTNNHAIRIWKQAARDRPQLIMHKFDCGPWGILPTRDMWAAQYPKVTHVGTPCFLTRRDIWYEYIQEFGAPTAGDFCYLRALWPYLASIAWLDIIMGKVQQIGKGVPELA
jgi:hypothetical protein